MHPPWGAKNNIQLMLLAHNQGNWAETASAQELATMAPGLRDMAPPLREVMKKFTELGPDGVLADAFPEGAQALLNALTRQAGATRDMLKKILEDRGRTETERLSAAIDLYVSNVTGDKKGLVNTLKEAAKPYYDKAFDSRYKASPEQIKSAMDGSARMGDLADIGETGEVRDMSHVPEHNRSLMSNDIARVLGTRIGKKSFNEALETMTEEPFWSQYSVEQAKLERKRILANAVYEGPTNARVLSEVSSQAQGFSLEFLDRVQRELSSAIDNATTAQSKRWIPIANTLRRELERLDETKGVYKLAKSTARSKFKMEEAYDLGKTFRTLNPEDISKKIKNMSEGEKTLFRAAAAEELKTLIEYTRTTGQAAPQIVERKRSMDQLMAFLPKEEAAKFKKALERELVFAKTQRGALGGGAGRPEDDQVAIDALKTASVLGASRVAPSSSMFLASNAVRRAVGRVLSSPKVKELTVKMLLTKDRRQVATLLRQLSKMPNNEEALRARDFIIQALAQKTRTLGEERVQVPVSPGKFQMKRQPRTPGVSSLGDILSRVYSTVTGN
jgi:hypothetical protein